MADNDTNLNPKRNHCIAYIGALSVSLAFMTMGIHIGWVNPTIIKLNDRHNPDFVGREYQSWIVASLSLSHVIFTIPAGIMADKVGRKSMLFLSLPPNVICWLILVFDDSFFSMIASRTVAGLAFAITATVAPVYLSEIAPDHIRGRMALAFQIMFNFGVLYEYIIATYIGNDRLIISLTAVVPLIFGAMFPWMEESPIYLIRKERAMAEKALANLRGIKSITIIHSEMERIDKSFLDKDSTNNLYLRLCCKKGALKPLFLGFSLIFFQQMSGVAGVLNFARSLTQLGAIGPIVYGVARMVALCIVPFLVDNWGRRPLLMVSNLFSAIFLIILGILFYRPQSKPWVIDILMVFFNAAHIFGSGSLPMVIIAELMPSEYRASALAVSQVVMALVVLFVTKTFLSAIDTFGTSWVLWLCSVNCFMGLVFTSLFLPETKGKSFMEIQEELRKPLLIESTITFWSKSIVRLHGNASNS